METIPGILGKYRAPGRVTGPQLPRVLGRSNGTEGGARQGEHERKIGQTQGMWNSRGVQDPSETENTWELEKTCSVEYGV